MMAPVRPQMEYHRPTAWLYYAIAGLTAAICALFFGVRIRRDSRLRAIRGPLIIIGNHPSYLDPPILAMAFFSLRISFLTSQSFFRKPIGRWILDRVSAIPKVQFRTDSRALKQMLRVIRGDGILAIYPEGQRSLDGSRQPFDEAIAKLVKKTGCPVAVVREKGAYLSWPRWSRSGPRFGRIEVTTRLLFTKEDLAGLETAEIKSRIEAALNYNDYGWQRRRPRLFLSLAPARGLHNLCHQCPACGRSLAMISSRFRLTCRFCGNQARMDRFGFLRPTSQGLSQRNGMRIWPDPFRWHQWQLQETAKLLMQPDFVLGFPAAAQLLNDDGTVIPAGSGRLRLTVEQLSFEGETAGDIVSPPLKISFPLRNISGVSAEYGHSFEIAQADRNYRFIPGQGQAVILIIDAIRAFQPENLA
jgi:1-acyl-sn-glycerol-3-phosphate acyltransferase